MFYYAHFSNALSCFEHGLPWKSGLQISNGDYDDAKANISVLAWRVYFIFASHKYLQHSYSYEINTYKEAKHKSLLSLKAEKVSNKCVHLKGKEEKYRSFQNENVALISNRNSTSKVINC